MTHQEEWEENLPPHPQLTPERSQESLVKGLRRMVLRHWQPEPVPPPVVDLDLPHLSAIERAAEVLRYITSRVEYWLSPSGKLREFIKLNIRLAVSIAIPVFLVGPLVSLALELLGKWITLLSATMSSFILFPLSVVLSMLLVCGMIYIGKSILEMRIRAQRREHYY